MEEEIYWANPMDGHILIGYPLSDTQKEMLRYIGLEKELRHFSEPYVEVLRELLRKYYAALVINIPFHIPVEVCRLRELQFGMLPDVYIFDFEAAVSFNSPRAARARGDVVIYDSEREIYLSYRVKSLEKLLWCKPETYTVCCRSWWRKPETYAVCFRPW